MFLQNLTEVPGPDEMLHVAVIADYQLFWKFLTHKKITFNYYFQETQEKAVEILPTAIMGEGEAVCQGAHFGGAGGAFIKIVKPKSINILYLLIFSPQLFRCNSTCEIM